MPAATKSRSRPFSVVRAVVSAFTLFVVASIAFAWAPDRSASSLAARWAPPPSTFRPIDGMLVHVRDTGPRDDPMPVVLIHGTSSSLHTWQGWTDVLATHHRVISFDLPGFGLTGPEPSGDYHIEHYARFVTHVLDALHVARCTLIGNSLGGNIAWETAVRAPERVARLVLVDASGYATTATSVPLGFRLARMPVISGLVQHLLTHWIIAQSLRNVFGDPSRVTPALVDRYYELTLREGNRASVVERFKQSRAGEHESLIRTVRVPTLIVWGGRDRLIPPVNSQHFHRDIAGSELVVFPALGHVPQEESPAETVAAVELFLARTAAQ